MLRIHKDQLKGSKKRREGELYGGTGAKRARYCHMLIFRFSIFLCGYLCVHRSWHVLMYIYLFFDHVFDFRPSIPPDVPPSFKQKQVQ